MGGFGSALKKIFNQKRGHLVSAWKFRSHTILFSSSVVEDIDNDQQDEILFGTKTGEITCLTMQGMPKWKFNVHENLTETEMFFFDPESMNAINASPLVTDINNDGKKEVIFGSETGNVYCLNHFGQLLWKYKAESSIKGAVADFTLNGKSFLVFGSIDQHLYVLNSAGNMVWKIKAKSVIESTPCVMHDHILFGTDDGTLYCVDFKGNLLWGYKTKGKIIAQPVVEKLQGTDEYTVVVGSYDGYLYAFDMSGNLKWKFNAFGPIAEKVTLCDVNSDNKQEIFFGSCNNLIYALNCNGDKLWEYETNFWVVAPVIVADIDNDGRFEVIAGSYDNAVYVLDSEGKYDLDYVPGLSGVVQQAGHYTDIMTQDPGNVVGTKILDYQSDGIIVGMAYSQKNNVFIVNEKQGEVEALSFVEEKG
ncbi:hypothetical protein C4573_00410 [Candidatus Woesearchaeota archaeon]|nr:MAG: hypothetical protein C4573_00410 [Candidatus Woesearchaeota archaeon]